MPFLLLAGDMRRAMKGTYSSTVWRLSILFIIVPHFVEVVLVQLSYETREITVLEVFG